jgi:hypothetical protein
MTTIYKDTVNELLTDRVIEKLTIAQSIRRSSNPYRAAINSFSRREVIRSEDSGSDKKIFYFEDDSFLSFEVTYTAVEDGDTK